MTIEELLADVAVLPVVTIERLDDALPVASALLNAGLTAIEVALRTACAPAAVKRIRERLPAALLGVGTITTPGHVAMAQDACAQFLVSPGITAVLLDAMVQSQLPILPGIATASEAIELAERGIHTAKFFPARAAGGPDALRALQGPFPDLRFCPTGGIDEENAADYLALPNVICVGGSWMVPPDAINARDWKRVQNLAERAAALAPRRRAHSLGQNGTVAETNRPR